MSTIIKKILAGDLGQNRGGHLPVVDEILALAEAMDRGAWRRCTFGAPQAPSSPLQALLSDLPLVSSAVQPSLPEHAIDPTTEFERRLAEAQPGSDEAQFLGLLAATREVMTADDEEANVVFWECLALSTLRDVSEKFFMVEIDPGPGPQWIAEVQMTFEEYGPRAMDLSASTRSIRFVPRVQAGNVVSF